MLLWCWFAAIDCARRHVVDKVVVSLGKSVLFTLQKQCDLAPLERAVGIAECAGPMLLGFGGSHTFGITECAGILDFGTDLLFVGVCQAAIFDVCGEGMNIDPVGLQQPLYRKRGCNKCAGINRLQLANAIAEFGAMTVVLARGDFWREGHDCYLQQRSLWGQSVQRQSEASS